MLLFVYKGCDIMDKISTSVLDYISSSYDVYAPIFIKEIYKVFPDINKNTIRSLFKRFKDQGKLIIIDKGVYALPNVYSIFEQATVYAEGVAEEKYIRTIIGKIIGYNSGINFANSLGLTSQTASVPTIFSNIVSDKKRMTKIKNKRIIINRSRVEVTKENFKLLQILDLLNDFDKYCEKNLKEASEILLKYLTQVTMSETELDRIVSAYPLKAQVKFYKIGGQYAVAQK